MHGGEISEVIQREVRPHDEGIEDLIVMWLRLLHWRELFGAIIAGLMPMLLYGSVPSWYRWLGIGCVVIVFLLWSLPPRGSGLIEMGSAVERCKHLLLAYLLIFFSIVSSFIIYFICTSFFMSNLLFLIDMPSRDWFSSGCMVFSSSFSTVRLLPRRGEFDGRAFLFVDYRVSLSWLVWSLFTLPVTLLIVIGHSVRG